MYQVKNGDELVLICRTASAECKTKYGVTEYRGALCVTPNGEMWANSSLCNELVQLVHLFSHLLVTPVSLNEFRKSELLFLPDPVLHLILTLRDMVHSKNSPHTKIHFSRTRFFVISIQWSIPESGRGPDIEQMLKIKIKMKTFRMNERVTQWILCPVCVKHHDLKHGKTKNKPSLPLGNFQSTGQMTSSYCDVHANTCLCMFLGNYQKQRTIISYGQGTLDKILFRLKQGVSPSARVTFWATEFLPAGGCSVYYRMLSSTLTPTQWMPEAHTGLRQPKMSRDKCSPSTETFV